MNLLKLCRWIELNYEIYVKLAQGWPHAIAQRTFDKFLAVYGRNMSKQIGVSVPDSETLSSEKSKRFTVSENFH